MICAVGVAAQGFKHVLGLREGASENAAGRHSPITGLVKDGATLVEAKELVRHADVRQTMKYTHIGLDNQAQSWRGCLPLGH